MSTGNDNAQVNVRLKRGGLCRITGILFTVIGLYWFAHKAGLMQIKQGQAAIFWPIVVTAAGLILCSAHHHTT